MPTPTPNAAEEDQRFENLATEHFRNEAQWLRREMEKLTKLSFGRNPVHSKKKECGCELCRN